MKNKKLVIDLFAGVGGLSLSAARAGFTVGCAVELDSLARQMHALNFPRATHLADDIKTLSGETLLTMAEIDKKDLVGLIGGPPCQGFSVIGRKSTSDPRNSLLEDFFRLVAEIRPAFFLAENVPGVLLPRNATTLSSALARIPENYTILEPFTVKACDYGAPTTRTRVFFFGYDPNRADKLVEKDFAPRRPEDVRVRDALSSLPAVRSHWATEAQSWRVVGELNGSRFARNVTGNVPRGVGNPEALERYRSKRQVSGFLGTIHTADTVKRFDSLAPGQSDPVSRGVRLRFNGYCPTLRAGTGPDRGSYQAVRPIHPVSPRVITPREAARLQGFPDWFQFHPTKWHAFRQIGNSVSPIVGEALLRRIYDSVE